MKREEVRGGEEEGEVGEVKREGRGGGERGREGEVKREGEVRVGG